MFFDSSLRVNSPNFLNYQSPLFGGWLNTLKKSKGYILELPQVRIFPGPPFRLQFPKAPETWARKPAVPRALGGYVLTGDSGIRAKSAQMTECLRGPIRRQRVSRGRQQELLVFASLLADRLGA